MQGVFYEIITLSASPVSQTMGAYLTIVWQVYHLCVLVYSLLVYRGRRRLGKGEKTYLNIIKTGLQLFSAAINTSLVL